MGGVARGVEEEVFADFQIIKSLGHGGFGTVHLVERVVEVGGKKLSKLFALKRILPSFTEDPKRVARFLHEMEVAVGLDHPGLVEVVWFGEHEGTYYLVLEYVRGLDLRSLAKELSTLARRTKSEWPGQEHGLLPPEIVAWIGMRAAIALDHLHTRRAEGRALRSASTSTKRRSAPRGSRASCIAGPTL